MRLDNWRVLSEYMYWELEEITEVAASKGFALCIVQHLECQEDPMAGRTESKAHQTERIENE